ncbi:molybdopterin-guanine dinucleotide biosynthesis protein A [Frondihabitans sp. PhB188]|uniref:molybdenum cofactor guanylyltransferase n=1 Tax=Frondihabitans sp. PhB188 TaxID=2485200 RepID=UPI000F937EA7|nr:NTP transferase domain-containing protein [Frondihabitans sp. PhB188]ROQ38419.1 molybdopterin-guanine dinucleotide biosynthesis protein A [Frondihabitans sp. PhB188]
MPLAFDAVLLAGGRASRVGGLDKTAFTTGGSTLLDLAVEAAGAAAARVVVGLRDGRETPAGSVATREHPPWSGPVAAVAAGLAAVPEAASEFVLVLACDLPRAPEAVRVLLDGASAGSDGGMADGWIAVDDDVRRQPLLALYRRAALDDRLAALSSSVGLANLSLRRMLDGVELIDVAVPTELCADVDTVDDARRWGVVGAPESTAG